MARALAQGGSHAEIVAAGREAVHSMMLLRAAGAREQQPEPSPSAVVGPELTDGDQAVLLDALARIEDRLNRIEGEQERRHQEAEASRRQRAEEGRATAQRQAAVDAEHRAEAQRAAEAEDAARRAKEWRVLRMLGVTPEEERLISEADRIWNEEGKELDDD